MKTFLQYFVTPFLLSSLLLSLPAAAQTKSPATAPLPPASYKLVSVKVNGSKRFTQEEIAAASGLPIGTIAHEEDFKAAARHLGESGAFGDITFSYSYSSA